MNIHHSKRLQGKRMILVQDKLIKWVSLGECNVEFILMGKCFQKAYEKN